MIDMHSHILPGLDDGAGDWEQALAMARAAVADGIAEMVCTPHWVLGKYENSRERILPCFAEFKARLAHEKVPLKIHAGAELRIDTTLLNRLKSGEVLTIGNSSYVLLELPDDGLPSDLHQFFWELQVNGYRPILSHVERNPFIRENPGRLVDWVERGALTQITAASLQTGFASEIREFAVFLVQHRLAHMLVTDTHGLRMRRPELSGARAIVESLVGSEAATRMVRGIPELILRGEPVTVEDPLPIAAPKPKKRFWSFLQASQKNLAFYGDK